MRILYLTRGHRVHDRRFVEAISALGHEPLLRELARWDTEAVHRAIQAARPDLVHAGPIRDVARLAAAAGARPLVTMSWGFDLLGDQHSGEAGDIAWTLDRTDVLVVDCEPAASAAQRFGFPRERMFQLPWGVDLDEIDSGLRRTHRRLRREFGWEDAVVVVSARAHEPIYGVDVVIDGFAAAAALRPDLRLLVIGSGSLTPKLIDQAATTGLADRIQFIGSLAHSELLARLAAADVYVSASHVDGSSVTLLEAMACSLPAIVSDIPGNREWVEPSASGMWFADGDAPSLAAALVTLADSSTCDRARMGARGRAIVADRADWRHNRRCLADAYALARSRGS